MADTPVRYLYTRDAVALTDRYGVTWTKPTVGRFYEPDRPGVSRHDLGAILLLRGPVVPRWAADGEQ